MANLRQRKAGTVLALLLALGGMVGLTAASVPLYRLFCRVTGYQGTTQRAEAAPRHIADDVVTVRFNADVNPALAWTFTAPQPMKLKLGETGLAFFKAKNDSREPITGTAVFNVTPDQAGRYFDKIACFCFTAQTLAPGQEAEMPVSFFVDPAILKDRDAKDVHTITLSYTFYPKDQGGERARTQASRDDATSKLN
ncbi:MAG TPA: cytochrome c oxidase assembly protein [Alphaproteobacteria bacterium]|nr:cytochrome c oxidase assembly protein [Alphaproteobacteria bacterium]